MCEPTVDLSLYEHCEGEVMKPEAILFCNENKAGVDCMDQMVIHFTTERSTRHVRHHGTSCILYLQRS